MDIIEIDADEYGKVVGEDVPLFCRKEFLELNSDKADTVHYLLGRDSKNRFAFAIGSVGNKWLAPFSAPFSDIISLRKNSTMGQIWEFIAALNKYVKNSGAHTVSIYLPANVYNSQSNAKIMNALLGNGYQLEYEDINYSFDLRNISIDDYSNSIQHMARKNLNIAFRKELTFYHCDGREEKSVAYDVIKKNREYRGFPLHMSKEQLMNTIKIVDHDFFLIKLKGTILAAAVVYHLTNKIAQVIYWGNLPGTEQYKPINFVAYKLIEYYKEKGFTMIDIGISTEEGKPNFGLCTFKESIGCVSSSKYRFTIEFSSSNPGGGIV